MAALNRLPIANRYWVVADMMEILWSNGHIQGYLSANSFGKLWCESDC